MEAVKWGTDYLIKAHSEPFVLYGVVRTAAEERGVRWKHRPLLLAAAGGHDDEPPGLPHRRQPSMVFRHSNPAYSYQLLSHAKQYRGKYDGGITVARRYYRSYSGYGFVTKAAFLLIIYSDYITSAGRNVVCAAGTASPAELLLFAKSQVDYILGDNPRSASYMVGYGSLTPNRSAIVPPLLSPLRSIPRLYSTVMTNKSTKIAKQLVISVSKLYGPVRGLGKSGNDNTFPTWLDSLPAGKSFEFVYIHSASPADILVSGYTLVSLLRLLLTMPSYFVAASMVLARFGRGVISGANLGDLVEEPISGTNPRDLAEKVISGTNLGDLVKEPISSTNPGDLAEEPISGTNPGDLAEKVISGTNHGDLAERVISDTDLGDLVEGVISGTNPGDLAGG
ncbi:hypothetical protein BHM03_00035069 [Ensete ventricosum]|nr:hypothetical protein BHM03_00035069 [Ensete ventricosum]